MPLLAVLLLASVFSTPDPVGQIISVRPGNAASSVSVEASRSASPRRPRRGPDPGGGSGEVDGEGWVEVSSTIEVRYLDETERKRWETCWNACVRVRDGNGNVSSHPRHEECDASCDRRCARDHKFTLIGEMDPPLRDDLGLPVEIQMAATGGMRAAEFGFSGFDWREIARPIQQACQALEADLQKEQAFDIGHTLLTPYFPCGQQLRIYGRRRGELWVHVSVRQMFASGGKQISLGESSQNFRVRSFWQPQSDPLLDSPKYIFCACQWLDERPREWFRTGREVGLSSPRIEHGERACGLPPYDGKTGFADAHSQLKDFAGSSFEVVCTGNDLNTATIDIINNSAEPVRLFLPAGTMLISDDPAVQDMFLAEDFIHEWSAEASLAGPPSPKSVRVHCAEIMQKEPTPRTRFAILAAPNDNVAMAASQTASSRFRGPWDQARVWALTDFADLAEINRRLIPGISVSQHNANLHMLAAQGSFAVNNPRQSAMVDKIDWYHSNPRSAAVRWFVQVQSRRLRSIPPAPTSNQIHDLTTDGGEAAALWIDALLASPNREFRLAGLRLAVAVPTSERSNLAAKGAFSHMANSLLSNDPTETRAAREAITAYNLTEWQRLFPN